MNAAARTVLSGWSAVTLAALRAGLLVTALLAVSSYRGVFAAEENILPVGQRLHFRIYWGIIPVAETSVSVDRVELDACEAAAIRVRTRSNAVVEKIYPVDDLIESIVDPCTLLPRRFTKKLSEGRYRCNEVTEFDHAAGVARWRSLLSGRTKEYSIEPDTRDIVSFMFSLRTARFVPGRRYHYRVMADEKIYDLWLRVLGREEVKLLDGTRVECLRLEPEAAFQGLFVRKGRMWIWVTESPPLVVTRMVARVPVASIKMILERLPPDAE